MSAILFLLETIVTLYIFILLLRVGMQWIRADYYNPASQFVVKMTHPLVGPIRRIIPSIGRIDTASLIIAYLFSIIKCVLIFRAAPGSIFLFALFSLIKSIGYFIFWLLIIRAITSWISRQNGAIDHLLYQLTEPFLAPIRRFIPPIAGIDFSAMIILIILIFFNKLAFDFLGPIWLYV